MLKSGHMIEDFSKIEEDEERDCPVCAGSGPCYRCERGRAVAQEFKLRQSQVARGQRFSSSKK